MLKFVFVVFINLLHGHPPSKKKRKGGGEGTNSNKGHNFEEYKQCKIAQKHFLSSLSVFSFFYSFLFIIRIKTHYSFFSYSHSFIRIPDFTLIETE